jgi:hypothetical protein
LSSESNPDRAARTPRRRSFARAALAVLTFTTVLGIRISPWPAESATGYAHQASSGAEEGAAIVWLGIAAIVLAKAFSRPDHPDK